MKTLWNYLLLVIVWQSSLALAAADDDFVFYSDLARDWYEAGDYFEWISTTLNNNEAAVQVFYRTIGNPDNPQLLLVHGFPNSSFDYHAIIPLLEDDYYIATLDFPGSGFSDKPLDGFSYMLEDNAKLLYHFITEIVGFDDFAMYTHDRGVSIGLAFLGNYLDTADPGYEINYHFLSNSGMFLPLANLVPFQLAMLDPERGPEMISAIKSQPRLTEGDPVDVAYADMRKFNDGDAALLHVGKYLLERAENETRWLENLPRSPVPVAYLWGMLDTVNPVRISHHVWQTYMNGREAESSYWILPTADHYPQRDNPEEVVKIIRFALSGQVPSAEDEDAFMRRYAGQREPEDGIYIGRSRVRKMEFPFSDLYTPDGYVQ